MTSFANNGPDIPEYLLRQHEEGNVVFFCGSGISLQAGLPTFEGLVNDIYAELPDTQSPIEERLYREKKFDSVLHELERRHPGHRATVRKVLHKVLTPNLNRNDATTIHNALLQLSTGRDGRVRLVTTNFDRIFEEMVEGEALSLNRYAAPLLPIPKTTKWDGLVYLHGLLPRAYNETELNKLVLSSGDFGLAYLTERWAARFVAELFRNHIVCFVGYSVNDPVMRYMMDAIAADEQLGEHRSEVYAFASFREGEGDRAQIDWDAKGITPLLYEIPKRARKHSALIETLKEWGETYRDGVGGKQMIVSQHASNPPLTPAKSDYEVGRVLWALTDRVAAKYFAEMNPAPPLDWLVAFSENQFSHTDLPRFGVTANREVDEKLNFSLLKRPSPYTRAPNMSLAGLGEDECRLDDVMWEIARWLTRHLNNPRLILWFANQGGHFHSRMSSLIQGRIQETAKLEATGDKEKIDELLEDSPDGLPDKSMRTLWGVLLSGRAKEPIINLDLYGWAKRLKVDGLTPSLRMELREALSPRVEFKAPLSSNKTEKGQAGPRAIKEIVNWDVTLASDHANSALRDIISTEEWATNQPRLLVDLSGALEDALELMWELQGVDCKTDFSYIHQPSISEHDQNQGFRDWTILIELVRDAWLETARADVGQAERVIHQWWSTSFPVFKRLALFAFTAEGVVSASTVLNWLVAEDAWWLWSVETQRELLRLLAVKGSSFPLEDMRVLESTILQGPPRNMFREEVSDEDFGGIVDRNIWLRLAKLQASGVEFGKEAAAKYRSLGESYPNWGLSDDQQEEFPFWMGRGDDIREHVRVPDTAEALAKWLREFPEADHWKEDDWGQRCQEDFPNTSRALLILAEEGVWPEARWQEALYAWSREGNFVLESWGEIAPALIKATNQILEPILRAVSSWLKSGVETIPLSDELFMRLCVMILAQAEDDGLSNNDPVGQAINHPVGHVTEALIKWWYRHEPKADEGLPDDLLQIFTEICRADDGKYRHGRVLLAAHLINLYRVDEEWAKGNLIPLFNWNESITTAKAAWEGFLWSPRLYRPLVSAMKELILETAAHYDELGDHAGQYADFLAFVSVDRGDVFSVQELATATRMLPPAGLYGSLRALQRALASAGDQKGEYWQHRVKEYLRHIWPKTEDVLTKNVIESLALICINAGDNFPDALETIGDLIRPIDDVDYVIHRAQESRLWETNSEELLTFLDLVIPQAPAWLHTTELSECLDGIEEAQPELSNDPRFARLRALVLQFA